MVTCATRLVVGTMLAAQPLAARAAGDHTIIRWMATAAQHEVPATAAACALGTSSMDFASGASFSFVFNPSDSSGLKAIVFQPFWTFTIKAPLHWTITFNPHEQLSGEGTALGQEAVLSLGMKSVDDLTYLKAKLAQARVMTVDLDDPMHTSMELPLDDAADGFDNLTQCMHKRDASYPSEVPSPETTRLGDWTGTTMHLDGTTMCTVEAMVDPDHVLRVDVVPSTQHGLVSLSRRSWHFADSDVMPVKFDLFDASIRTKAEGGKTDLLIHWTPAQVQKALAGMGSATGIEIAFPAERLEPRWWVPTHEAAKAAAYLARCRP